ncbi:GPI anchored serine-threonine rich protein [Grosmannia clavigera kw1407]|uniref:GPI anchored serine-threonine rich protein n=1 Tax=Grosmannia clavigera (strain kw1407 / UAMH 11150) TaxID=655863 RepID=F0XHH6_GROCL|nr:GPI anchored serine-threonine rich protein [Grosmannia clavigera kw1407]EFX02708.1 GPI anchored serine-threonine rich protein [Grosmannia clavigera kw1407]
MIFTAASILALAVSALAQTAGFDAISKPTDNEQLTAGDSYAITWEPSSTYTGTVSIALLGGATPQTLQVLSTISSGVKNSVGSYSWSVGSDLGTLETYGIRITLDSDTSVFQYSYPFHITASEAKKTTATGTTSSSSTATVALSTTSSILAPVTTVSTAIETSTTCTASASVSSAPATSAQLIAHIYNSTASAPTTLATAVSSAGSLYTTKSSNYTKVAFTGTASANQTTATSTVVQAGATSNAASFFAALAGGLAVSFFLM